MRFLLTVCVVIGLSQACVSAEPPSHETLRELRVLAVAGLEYRLYYQDWQDRMRQIVAGASRHTEQHLKLKFTVGECRAWDYQGGRSPKNPDETIEQLLKVNPGKCDLVVAFTMVAFPGPEAGSEIRGFTQHFSRYVVVPDQWVVAGAQTRLVHELCHVFGAFHEADPDSVMRPAYHGTPRQFEFSPVTREVIALTKGIDLTQGVASLSPETARRLREIYRAHHHPRESIDEDPIARAYGSDAQRAEMAGDQNRARKLREIASVWKSRGELTGNSATEE